MDCHVFRRLCDELAPALTGARMEKIHQPAPDVIQFTLYGKTGKSYLFLKAGRQAPFLFLSSHKLSVGSAPPASIMFLRKHLSDRRIVEVRPHWIERQLYLRIGIDATLWLCLDLREGATLLFGDPQEPLALTDALWPDAAQLSALLALPKETATSHWRAWPVLTPPLRRTLPYLPPDEQIALLYDLEAGGGDVFLYEDTEGNREISAWPLPPELRSIKASGRLRDELILEDPLAACAAVGESQVLKGIATQSRKDAAKPYLTEAARLGRLLEKLHLEQQRLSDMAAKQTLALALQAELYRFPPDAKYHEVQLDAYPEPVALDPRLTVRENMAALFHTAGRGKRGLAMLTDRVNTVQASLDDARRRALGAEAVVAQPTTAASGKRPQLPDLPKNVQAFRSSDGFLILRGRDAKGNAQVLKMASPHDLWMHTGGGPGAHVLVRRDHAAQIIPQTTLDQAAILTAIKSWRKDETNVDILTALAKFVHPMRGAKPGTVRIDRSEASISITPDPSLEERLAL